jgi:hypothetical protein
MQVISGLKWLGAAAAVAVLAGCGEAAPPPPSEAHIAFAKACVAGGGDGEQCECRAGKIDALVTTGELSAEFQRAVLLQEQGKEDEAEAIMQTMGIDESFKQLTRVGDAQLECHEPS